MRNLLAAFGLLITTSALAEPPETGPFGFTQGMTLADLKKFGTVEQGPQPHLFKMKTAPKPHSAFEVYSLILTPNTGLCKVSGIGRDINTNGYGFELKNAFEKLESILGSKYGPSDKVDRLLSGSIWKDSKDWMMGLKRKERLLATVWSTKYGSTLPRDVEAMMLEAKAGSQDMGWVRLEIEFKNFDDCLRQFSAKDDAAL